MPLEQQEKNQYQIKSSLKTIWTRGNSSW